MKAADIREGDMVAAPIKLDPVFRYEFATVCEITREPGCVVLWLEGSVGWAIKPGHRVRRIESCT